MISFRQTIFLLLTAFTLGSCGAPQGGGCRSPWAGSSDQFLGSQATNFVLPNLAGEEVGLANLASQKPTLLVFWATWCPTCVEEIPVLKSWSEKYPELQILAINVEEPAARVQAFAKKYKIHYSILLDQEGDVAHEYGLVGIPAAVLLAKGGRVIYYGFSLPGNIEQLIEVKKS